MAKRPNPRSIRAARTYTMEEAARALGVSIGTVRAWAKVGLPILRSERPYLILGEALREFLQNRRAGSKVQMQPDQFYCATCKTPVFLYGRMVDLVRQNAKTARLTGLCDRCGGACNRMISPSSIGQFGQIFDLKIRVGQTA